MRPGRIDKADDRETGDGFARAGFADKAQDLARPTAKRHVVDGLDDAGISLEMRGEMAHDQRWRGRVGAHSVLWRSSGGLDPARRSRAAIDEWRGGGAQADFAGSGRCGCRHGPQASRISTTPATTSSAAPTRQRVSGSPSTSTEIRAANSTLVSRRAATSAIGACVIAQTAMK